MYLDIVTVVMIFLFSFLSLHFLLFFNLLNFYLWCTYSLPRYLATRYSLLRCCVTLWFSKALIVIIKTSPLLIFFEGTFAPKKSLVYNHWLSLSSQLEEWAMMGECELHTGFLSYCRDDNLIAGKFRQLTYTLELLQGKWDLTSG